MQKRGFGMDLGEAVVPVITLVFGAAFFIQTTDAPMDALFWPLITAAITGGFLLAIIHSFVLKRPDQKTGAPAPGRFSVSNLLKGRVALILYASVGYLLLIPYLGFTLTNFVFMLVVFRSLGSKKWGQNLAVGAGISLFLYLALVVLMKQELPTLAVGNLPI